jgi:hypothetical protein
VTGRVEEGARQGLSLGLRRTGGGGWPSLSVATVMVMAGPQKDAGAPLPSELGAKARDGAEDRLDTPWLLALEVVESMLVRAEMTAVLAAALGEEADVPEVGSCSAPAALPLALRAEEERAASAPRMFARAESSTAPVDKDVAAEAASPALTLRVPEKAPARAVRAAAEEAEALAALAMLLALLDPAARGQRRVAVEDDDRAEAAAAMVEDEVGRELEVKRDRLAPAAAALVAVAAACPALLHSAAVGAAAPVPVPRIAPAAAAALRIDRGSPAPPLLAPPPAVSAPMAMSADVCPAASVGVVSVSGSSATPLPPHASTATTATATAPPARVPALAGAASVGESDVLTDALA